MRIMWGSVKILLKLCWDVFAATVKYFDSLLDIWIEFRKHWRELHEEE